MIIGIMSWVSPESLLQLNVFKSHGLNSNLISNLIKNPIFVAKHFINSKETSLVFTRLKSIYIGFLTIYNDEDNKSNLKSVPL